MTLEGSRVIKPQSQSMIQSCNDQSINMNNESVHKLQTVYKQVRQHLLVHQIYHKQQTLESIILTEV